MKTNSTSIPVSFETNIKTIKNYLYEFTDYHNPPEVEKAFRNLKKEHKEMQQKYDELTNTTETYIRKLHEVEKENKELKEGNNMNNNEIPGPWFRKFSVGNGVGNVGAEVNGDGQGGLWLHIWKCEGQVNPVEKPIHFESLDQYKEFCLKLLGDL